MHERILNNFWETLKSGKPWMGLVKTGVRTATITG